MLLWVHNLKLDAEIKEINAMIRKVETGTITKVNRLNEKRAKAFRIMAIDDTKYNRLKLKKNQPATVKIQGWYHAPEYFTGALLKAMEIMTNDDLSVDAGYLPSNKKKPKNSKITYTQIALLQTTGFRIPLQGEKGERVRRFLAAHGIFMKKTKNFLRVSPRPFLQRGAERFDAKGLDTKIINQYMKDLWIKL